MNLQQAMRVIVFAGIVALCVAGVGLFPTQPVAGQETKSGAVHGAAALDQLKVEDGEAMYPLTIDPISTIQQKLLAADGAAGDLFGDPVALDGDTLVAGAFWDDIGANANQGSAYVFTRSGAVWTERQKLTASDGAAGNQFGYAVALKGDTVVISAPVGDLGGQEPGSVYVFTRSGAVWTERQKLTASDGAWNDGFGVSVALDGDTLVVGATGDDIGPTENQGSAYVFTRNGGIWTEQQKLIPAVGKLGEAFGGAIALDGDTLVVGALDNNVFGPDFNKGSAYVFTRSGAVWTERQKLTASDGLIGDKFGSALALSGDMMAVGASGDDIGATIDQGSVYIFMRSGTAWTQHQKLTAGDGAMGDEFGKSVALSGDSLVVGALLDDIGANTNQGSAYAFTRSGAVWTEQQKLATTDGNAYGYFGKSVALSGNTVIVGAPQTQIGANFGQGSVFVFARPSCPTFVFAPANLPNGSYSLPYEQSVTVSGGAGSYQFTFASGVLPPGISLTPSGLLSGTPTTPGDYQFTISAMDLSSFCSGSHAYTITIIAPCPTLTINPPTLPNGAAGLPYSETLTAIGGMAPYKFVTKGKLPPGLSLAPNGVLSGTPTQTGNFNFTLGVIDARGCIMWRADSITIKPLDIGIGAAPPAIGGSQRVAHFQINSGFARQIAFILESVRLRGGRQPPSAAVAGNRDTKRGSIPPNPPRSRNVPAYRNAADRQLMS